MSVLQPFEEYQKARVKFVQAVADASTRPQNIEVMNNAGVMHLLRPLLLDNVLSFPIPRPPLFSLLSSSPFLFIFTLFCALLLPFCCQFRLDLFILYSFQLKIFIINTVHQVPSIQQTAALALGRLANYSEDLAEGIVGNEILPQLVYSLSEQNVSSSRYLALDFFFSSEISIYYYFSFFFLPFFKIALPPTHPHPPPTALLQESSRIRVACRRKTFSRPRPSCSRFQCLADPGALFGRI